MVDMVPQAFDILIRVDVNPMMGAGHLMRCIAFAQRAKQENLKVIFALCEILPKFKTLLEAEQLPYVILEAKSGTVDDAAKTKECANTYQVRSIGFDGYHFSEEYFEYFRQGSCQLWMIDDFAQTPDFFNFKVNYQPWAHSDKTSAQYQFIGLQYYFFRNLFLEYQHYHREYKSPNHILIIMGGTDANNFASFVLKALDNLSHTVQVTMIGKPIPFSSKHDVTTYEFVNDLPRLLTTVDIAITAGGGTCWELAYMKIPYLVVQQAENQRLVAEYAHKLNIGKDLGWHTKVTEQQIVKNVDELLTNDDLRLQMITQADILKIGSHAGQVIDYVKKSIVLK